MIQKTQLKKLIEDNLVASVRVIPVPMEDAWCIDIIVRRPMEIGASIETLATKADDEPRRISRYASIDAAADYLRSVGVETFTVDLQDAVSTADLDFNAIRVIETAERLRDDDPHSGDAA